MERISTSGRRDKSDGSGRLHRKQQPSSPRLSGLPAVLRQPVRMGLEKLLAGSKRRQGHEVPKMGQSLRKLHFTADYFVYFCTGIYQQILFLNAIKKVTRNHMISGDLFSHTAISAAFLFSQMFV